VSGNLPLLLEAAAQGRVECLVRDDEREWRMWDALSGVAFSLWGVVALGFAVLFGAVVWQLTKIAFGDRESRARRVPWGTDEQADVTGEEQI
jgi:nitrate reductase NapE component